MQHPLSRWPSFGGRLERDGADRAAAARRLALASLVPLLLTGCEDGPGEAGSAAGDASGAEADDVRPGVALLGEGVVSTADPEFGASLTPDGRELYFNRASPDRQELVVRTASRTDTGWSAGRVAPFSGEYRDLDAFVAPDGQRIYFSSDRPAADGGTADFDTWYVERADGGWSQPIRPGPPLNSDSAEVFVSATRDGVLFFTSWREGTRRVFRAAPEGGGWGTPEPVDLGDAFSPGNPLVAPDGSFLVVTGSGPDGSTDLFVACRGAEGWEEPARLPEPVNSAYTDFAPGLDPTDGTLLFTSERPGVAGAQPDSVRPPGDLYRSTLRPADVCGRGADSTRRRGDVPRLARPRHRPTLSSRPARSRPADRRSRAPRPSRPGPRRR